MAKRRNASGRRKADEREQTSTAGPDLPRESRKDGYLLVLAGPQFGEIFPLEDDRELLIGRSEDSDIQIRDEGVSRRHATLRVDGEAAVLRDLGSANGTYVDGVQVSEVPVPDGTRIHVGAHTTLKFIRADELDARYQMRLAEGALQDPLTGLYNRRHFEERLVSEMSAAQRHQRPVSLLMCDVDHFKAINDRHGHLAGDETLKMVAFVLRGAVRKEDVLARYGGEEFVVIARETPLRGAQALGERIRRAVEASRCTWQGVDLGVTASVGVATWLGPEIREGISERELLETADRALYMAKQGGRNRVVSLPSLPARAPDRSH